MNVKAVVIMILAVFAIMLGVGWWRRDRQADWQHEADEVQILLHSNEWVRTQTKFDEQVKINAALETNLTARSLELQVLSNRLSNVSDTLVKTEAEVKATQAEVAKRDARIAELENKNDDMTKKMSDLNGSIEQLEKQITTTELKLAASEGDRELLIKELKRLQAEKAALERQFNDLAILREQVKKLKDELSIARRLDWIRRGLYGAPIPLKGAELMQRGFAKPALVQTNLGLDAEIRQSGDVKIKSSTPTNAAPPTAAPPPK